MDCEQGWTCGAGDQGWFSTREEGESRFPQRPSTPGLPGPPRCGVGACPGGGHEMAVPHRGAAAHTAGSVAAGCTGAPRPRCPGTLLLPRLATAFTAPGLLGYPKIKLAVSRRTHLQQTTDGFPAGLLVLLAGAVKCDAPGAFSAFSVRGLQLWEYEEKVLQKTVVFFLNFFFPHPSLLF